jgi:hypothetical protein
MGTPRVGRGYDNLRQARLRLRARRAATGRRAARARQATVVD